MLHNHILVYFFVFIENINLKLNNTIAMRLLSNFCINWIFIICWIFELNCNIIPYKTNSFDEIRDDVCLQRCHYGYFRLSVFSACRRWLTCQELRTDVQIISRPILSTVKKVSLAVWDGFHIVIVHLRDVRYRDDFREGLLMLTRFQPSHHMTQLIGSCAEDDMYTTEFHPLGSALELPCLYEPYRQPYSFFRKFHRQTLYPRIVYKFWDSTTSLYAASQNSVTLFNLRCCNPSMLYYTEPCIVVPDAQRKQAIAVRFQACRSYVEVLSFLHSSPLGRRVMCDSNDLAKTLSQYLLTSDLRLVLNDLDALPEITYDQNIKCGHRQISGSFSAPEQRWNESWGPFNDERVPLYDEKSDIWKIPDVCEYLLSSCTEDDQSSLWFHLFAIFKRCKSIDPELRPSAREIMTHFDKIWLKFIS